MDSSVPSSASSALALDPSRLHGLVGAFISLFSTGVGSFQDKDSSSFSGDVLVSDFVEDIIDDFDGIGIGEKLITGENILVDLHFDGVLEVFGLDETNSNLSGTRF